ncbi:hypothetical protein BDR22DRAFT_874277 [Usnea florida]
MRQGFLEESILMTLFPKVTMPANVPSRYWYITGLVKVTRFISHLSKIDHSQIQRSILQRLS